MELLERDEPLATLAAWLEAAGSGAGRFVLVAGEAGVGKSALVQAFCRRAAPAARVWWGSCDALRTPRPLGPLHDIARDARGELAALMASDASRHERFVGFLEALGSPLAPTIAVIEDVHWADEATRDLLVYVARRLTTVNALVVATYRDDEVDTDHPLRQVLGNIATLPAVARIALSPLSAEGVARLAGGRPTDAEAVHRVTGGNPFFVTEVLASPDASVPPSVADAVLGRTHRLSAGARAVLAVAAMVPDQVELELLQQVAAQDPACIEECLDGGVLVATGSMVRFRHELARLAVAGSIPAVRRLALHRAVLTWLRERSGSNPARLAYHAEQAEDPDAIVTFGMLAAEEAGRLGAHREAYAHLARARRHIDLLPDRERAELIERFVEACRIVGRFEEAFAASGDAMDLLEDLGEVAAAAVMRIRRAMIAWNLTRNEEAQQLAASAWAMLEPLPPQAEHAQVLATIASMRMLARDIPAAIDLGRRALELAERSDDALARIIALGAIGAAQWFVEPDAAETTMLRALELARRSRDDARVAGVLGNLGSGAGEVRRYAVATRWLDETIAWSEERDLDYQAGYARAWAARVAFEQGRWQDADRLLARTARSPIEDGPTRIVQLTVDGRLRARRGDPGAAEQLEEAWVLAERTSDLQRLWPAAAGRAELAWLRGQVGDIHELVRETFGLAVRLEQRWAVGELAFWLWRAGELAAPPEGAAAPFARQIEGDGRAAAGAWEELGCPYEVAMALADEQDVDAGRRALTILGDLGATPLADRAAARLRDRGVRDLPRRPSRATVDNPAGLTERQLEVLALLADGLHNAEIAARLHISSKTVGHHVSAILDRLGVGDRHEAARVASERGLIDA